MEFNEEQFNRLTALKNPGDEEDLCDFIVMALDREYEISVHDYHANPPGPNAEARDKAYWRAKILHRAISYVEDWKNSI